MLKQSPRKVEEKDDIHSQNDIMEEISLVKEFLYNEIENMGEEEIHTLLEKNEFSKFIEYVFKNTLKKLASVNEKNDDELIGLAESISHYILTEMLIPSQRKIIYNNIDIDIVIPNIKKLINKPNDAILICFDKENDDKTFQKKINQITTIQKNNENIWIISKKMNDFHKTYLLDHTGKSFSNLFIDIKNFVISKNQNRLNIFKT